MRIVFINNFHTGQGGAERQMCFVMRGLMQYGVNVALVAPTGSEVAMVARELGVSVVETDFAKPRARTTMHVISELAAGGAAGGNMPAVPVADFVVGTGHWTNILVGMASLPAGVQRIALHQSMPDAADTAAERFARSVMARATMRRIDGHIAVSQAVKSALVKQGFPSEKIEVIYNGAELPPECNTLPDQNGKISPLRVRSGRNDKGVAELPPECNVQPEQSGKASPLASLGRNDRGGAELPLGIAGAEGPIIGFLGRIEKVKGPDTFLRMMKKVQESLPYAQGRLAGQGSMMDELLRLKGDLNLGASTQILGRQDAFEFLAGIDILVIPSRAEAFCIAAVEAQRAGKAIVAFDVGGIREALLNDKTTRLVPAGDIDALAAAVVEVAGKLPGMRAELGTAAEHALLRFTPDQTAESYHQYFLERQLQH